jgi:tetratricopeptide (TPR) repeat protein
LAAPARSSAWPDRASGHREAAGQPQAGNDEADDLYAKRADLGSARKAADLLRARLASDLKSFDSAWKLARVDYWLGGHAPEAQRRGFYEDGIAAARKAAALLPGQPEGHFWIAANMGMLAESFGIRAGLKYRTPVKDELETVLRIDPAFRQGSADRALGRWYDRVPGLFGGSKKLAEQHLRKALEYAPQSTVTHYFLAEMYADEGRRAEARAECQKVIDAPEDPDYVPEDREYKDKARLLLTKIR